MSLVNFMRAACTVVVLMIAGCTPNLPYRTSYAADDSPWADSTHAVIENHCSYKLGFVEFDDQGWFWDTQQDEAVQQMVRTQAGLPALVDPNPTTRPVANLTKGIILVTFVHGWKDNAEYNNEGVKAFRRILGTISKGEKADAEKHGHPVRNVVGVYAGWRGLSITWEPAKELSIWDRGDTAKRVGGNGALTQLFTQLENIEKESNDLLVDKAPPTEMVIIGHSLGASATYAALSQIVNERFVNSVGKGPVPVIDTKTGKDTGTFATRRMKPLGDQIILINPAFEAARHFDLNKMALAIEKYPEDQRPVLSIFTSRADWATHYVFPIAMFFPTLFDSYRDDGQQYWTNLETVGWYDPFTTHRLVYNPKVTYKDPDDASESRATTAPTDITDEEMKGTIDGIDPQRDEWKKPGPRAPFEYYFDKVALQPLPTYKPHDPFLIVSVDRQIIGDHSDISNNLLVNFIRDYIEFSRADLPTATK